MYFPRCARPLHQSRVPGFLVAPPPQQRLFAQVILTFGPPEEDPSEHLPMGRLPPPLAHAPQSPSTSAQLPTNVLLDPVPGTAHKGAPDYPSSCIHGIHPPDNTTGTLCRPVAGTPLCIPSIAVPDNSYITYLPSHPPPPLPSRTRVSLFDNPATQVEVALHTYPAHRGPTSECDASLLPPGLPLLLPHRSARSQHQHQRLATLLLKVHGFADKMTAKVRVFSPPNSLAARLAEPPANPATPRSVPEPPASVSSRQPLELSSAYTRMPMASYSAKKEGGITFAAQDKLPKLPIPELEDTCKRYLEVLAPLQAPRERAETRHAVQEFLKQDGPDLQEKLKKYAHGKTSYIEQFWYDSYLNFDNPVVLNLNPFFLLEDDPTPARNNQVTRAASLVVSALDFIRAVRKEELPPDMFKGTPLCMYQFSRLFGTARVPTENGCQIVQDPQSTHIAVMCHGQIYWFDVLDDNSDVIMTEKDIAVNLQTITEDAAQIPIQEAAKGALGVLSTENRKVWSGLRDVLTKDPGSNNADCLNIVDSALFVLCLDYTEPPNVAALCQNMLCGTSEVKNGVQIGTCTNRWYDKMQIIVCKNGSAGINFEHTGVDGHTVLRFASDVYTDTILRFARSINGQAPTLWASTSPDPSKRDPESFGDVNTTPRKLEWDMIPELSIAVRFAETRLADLIEQNEFQCLDFGYYGKNFITSMGFSPDAFVQMAFQAAYYGLYGRVECTYEPAMTKVYLHGRTEAVRTVTSDSVDFVQTFWADNPLEQKIEALKHACQKHVNRTKECAKAQGCDRHLYALFCVWQKYVDDEMGSGMSSFGQSSPVDGYSPVGSAEKDSCISSLDSIEIGRSRERGDSTNSRSRDSHPLPFIFADSGWDKLNTTVLSTSNCGNPSLRHFGFGPTSGDGFGIGYIIKDDSISICVSSKHRQTKRFVDALESYLLEIRRILRITNRKSSTAKTSRAREAEESRPKPVGRFKSRGRLVTGLETVRTPRSQDGSSLAEESTTASDDDELGGYGFFDAGMLRQALKARDPAADTSETKASERAAVQARRRDVGKKLRLTTE